SLFCERRPNIPKPPSDRNSAVGGEGPAPVKQRQSNGPASHRILMIDAPVQPIRIGNRWRDNGASNPQPFLAAEKMDLMIPLRYLAVPRGPENRWPAF